MPVTLNPLWPPSGNISMTAKRVSLSSSMTLHKDRGVEMCQPSRGLGVISKSPTTGIETPKREKNSRQILRSDEYTKMLSLAGANPRDYAILQVFLQTGIRVSELANLTRDDIDFVKPSIR